MYPFKPVPKNRVILSEVEGPAFSRRQHKSRKQSTFFNFAADFISHLHAASNVQTIRRLPLCPRLDLLKPMKPNTGSRERPAARHSSLLTREPLLLLGVLLAAFYFGRPLLIPLALALTLNFLLAPVVVRLQRLPLHRTPAVLLTLVAATALLGGMLWLVAGQLLTVVNELPGHAPNIRAKLDKTHVPADSSLGQAAASLEGLSREFSPDPAQQDAQQRTLAGNATARARSAARKAAAISPTAEQPTPVLVVQAPASEFAYLRQLLRPVLAPLGTAGMVFIFTVYMLIKREDLRNRLLLLAGIGRINLVSHALDDAADRISRFLIANVAVNTGFGILFAAGLYAIGMPYATLWGALLALLRTVPFAGTVVGGGFPVLFALIYFPAWWQAGCTLALIGLLEILVSNFLEPWLYGNRTGISGLALLVMAVVWSLLWGWPGLALSTPLTVCLIVVGRTMPQMSFLHILLGDDAELAPEARFYERMLAMDQTEARRLAEGFLDPTSSPGMKSIRAKHRDVPISPPRTALDLYDQVLLPALALAENDRHKGILEEHRAAFFFQSAAELIAERAKATKIPSILPLFDLAHPLLARASCPVVCIPTSDQADELAATMLAQLLEEKGHKTLLLPPSALTPELLARFARDTHTTLCLSALPPFALEPTRSLYGHLRSTLPRNRIIVGLWGSDAAPEALGTRFPLLTGDDAIVTTLTQAINSIHNPIHEHDRTFPPGDIYARSGAYATATAQSR